MNFTMAVGKRESAGVIMISSRLIHPAGWICAEPAVVNAPWIFIQQDPAISGSYYSKITLFLEYSVSRIKRLSIVVIDRIRNGVHISIHGHAADSWHINTSRWYCRPKIHRSPICWTFENCHVWNVRKYQTHFQQIGVYCCRWNLHVAINPLVLGVSGGCIRIIYRGDLKGSLSNCRQKPIIIVPAIHDRAQLQLSQIAHTLYAMRFCFCLGQSRQQHGGEDGYYRNNDQQFNQRETGSFRPGSPPKTISKII